MIKTESLKKSYEFSRIYNSGKYFVGKYIVLYVKSNNLNKNKIGIVISRKVGKSVIRNRIRRLIKENYRFYEKYLKDEIDLVFVVRRTEELPNYYTVKKEMKYLFKKLAVWNKD